MNIQFKKLYDNVKLPEYATDGSAGFDLIANNFLRFYKTGNNDCDEYYPYELNTDKLSMYPGSRMLIGLGFCVSIPKGYMMDIRPRSGNALKFGLTVLNTPGLIDSDYRGEVGVILYNTSRDEAIIKLGDKIAQGVIMKHETAEFQMVQELSDTIRGIGGFGHTDKK